MPGLDALLDDPALVRLEAEWSKAEREWQQARRGEGEAAQKRLDAAVKAYKARLADLGLLDRERVSDGSDKAATATDAADAT